MWDYKKGSIIMKKGIRFKETKFLDTRKYGHPVSLLLDTNSNDDYIYFVTMGSNDSYWLNDSERYLIIKPTNRNGLRKVSYVDLKYIYKYSRTNISDTGYLSDEDYELLLTRLIEFQKKIIPDSDYLEIEDSLIEKVKAKSR